MEIFGGVISIKLVSFLMFSLYIISFLGYAIGRITIKGLNLGTSGTFIVALFYGALFKDHLSSTVSQKEDGKSIDISKNALKVIENIGLILFIGSVGYNAGPTFFQNLKKNYKSFLILGLIIILSCALSCVVIFFIGKNYEDDKDKFIAILVGALTGALTTTPGFSAAKATVSTEYETAVTVGHGIAYIFGVVGVVIFVQIVPKILGADMEVERNLVLKSLEDKDDKETTQNKEKENELNDEKENELNDEKENEINDEKENEINDENNEGFKDEVIDNKLSVETDREKILKIDIKPKEPVKNRSSSQHCAQPNLKEVVSYENEKNYVKSKTSKNLIFDSININNNKDKDNSQNSKNDKDSKTKVIYNIQTEQLDENESANDHDSISENKQKIIKKSSKSANLYHPSEEIDKKHKKTFKVPLHAHEPMSHEIIDKHHQKKKIDEYISLDKFGYCQFSLAAVLGIFLGSIRIPLSGKGLDGSTFSLTSTGGILLTTLILSYFGRIWIFSLKIKDEVLYSLREVGLLFFLIGTGISGGVNFVEYFKFIYFIYGIIMTLVPMIIGFFFSKYVLKLPLLVNLGALTGGMTSTPALGTLINVAQTNSIANSYAATYPIALVCVVLASQFLIILL